MRIVAGAQRGRPIVAPKGHSTRPTADRTRQAMFNVIEHAAWSPGLAGARVLDLFAGSGALGLEALSRGAAFGLLADSDPAALAAVESNLTGLGLDGRARAWRCDATRLPALAGAAQAGGAPFDVAFLDPPYARGLAEPTLARLLDGGWLAPDALVVVERGAGEADLAAPGFAGAEVRVWGAAKVWFLRI